MRRLDPHSARAGNEGHPRDNDEVQDFAAVGKDASQMTEYLRASRFDGIQRQSEVDGS